MKKRQSPVTAPPTSLLLILQLVLLPQAAAAYRITLDLNTYTSSELAFAARTWSQQQLDGTWVLTNNSRWNGSATLPSDQQWRSALAAIGQQQYSEQMWPCSPADDAAWNCSSIARDNDHSADQCNVVRWLAPQNDLTGAFAYHECGTAPHTMLSWAEISNVSAICGGGGVIGHARLYGGKWKQMVDAVLAHPKLLGVAFELDITRYSVGQPIFGQAGPFAEAMLAAGKQPFFLLPFKRDGKNRTGMSAAAQMRAFLRNASAEARNASALDDPRVNIVIARYGKGGLLPVFPNGDGDGDNEDTVAAAVEAALQMKVTGEDTEKRVVVDEDEAAPAAKASAKAKNDAGADADVDADAKARAEAEAKAKAKAADSSWYAHSHHGPEFVNVLDFGAKADGITDDTAAIQRAIDHNRLQSGLPPPPTARPFAPPRRAVVYLPPGTYALSDTLKLWFFTQLRGSSVHPPTLLLKPLSPGFGGDGDGDGDGDGSALKLKPLLATAGGTNQSVPWWRDNFHANDMFYNQIHSLRIRIGAHNAGAVGLYWSIAQQTSLRGLVIEGANVGIDVAVTAGYLTPLNSSAGLGGGGTIEDITVVGGRYGMRVQGSQYTMRGLRFVGQSVSAIQVAAEVWSFAFATVEACNTPALLTAAGGVGDVSRRDPTTNNVLLLDVTLVNVSGGAAVSLPAEVGLPLLIENLTMIGEVRPSSATVMAGSAVWLPVPSTGHVTRWAGWAGQNAAHNRSNGIYVRGQVQARAQLQLPGTPRALALPSRPRPFFDEISVQQMCNAVTDCSAAGDNRTDDTAALQACVRRCHLVFLPSGVYRLTDTLLLNRSTKLVGEALTQLYLRQSSPGFADPAAPKAVLDTPDDAEGAVEVTDVSVQAGWGNAGAVLVRWRVGEASGLWDVHVNISHNVHIGMHVTGAGGGVLSNVWGWGADHSQWTGEHMSQDAADLGFLGDSAGPLWGFGVAFEHHRKAMFSLQGATGYTFLAMQTEQAWWLPTATGEYARTVHLDLGAGTANTTIYGALHCNWGPSLVTDLVRVGTGTGTGTGVGQGVSLFGLRDVGAKQAVSQPGDISRLPAAGRWFGVLADVEVGCVTQSIDG